VSCVKNGWSTSSVVFARRRQCAIMGGHIAATWRIRLNHQSRGDARYVKLRWPLIIFEHDHLGSRTDHRALRAEYCIVGIPHNTIQPCIYYYHYNYVILCIKRQHLSVSNNMPLIPQIKQELVRRWRYRTWTFTQCARSYPNSLKSRKITAITPFRVIQGHRFWYQSKAHIRFPISD